MQRRFRVQEAAFDAACLPVQATGAENRVSDAKFGGAIAITLPTHLQYSTRRGS